MPDETELARLIRFEPLTLKGMPGLLSWYEKDKNLIHINSDLVYALPAGMIDRLMFTEIAYTQVAPDGLTFRAY